MTHFSPKQALSEARAEEKKGNKRAAASRFSKVGQYLMRHGRHEDARTILSRVVMLTPESPRPYLLLGVCEINLEHADEAKQWVTQFSRLAVKAKRAEEYVPFLETELKDFPALRQIFYQQLLSLDRTSVHPFLSMAKAMVEQNDLDGAQRTLLDALRTRAEDRDVVTMLRSVLMRRDEEGPLIHLKRFEEGKLERTDLLVLLQPPSRRTEVPVDEENKDLKTLIEDLETELGIEPKDSIDRVEPLLNEFRARSEKIIAGDAQARMDLALAYFEMGLTAVAREELQKIPPEHKLYYQAQCLVGEVLLSEGSDLGALETFQRCLRAGTVNDAMALEARYRLIQIYIRLADYGQALTHYRELEKLAPGYRDARALKAALQSALGIELKAAVPNEKEDADPSVALPVTKKIAS